jgi:chloramphenicol-sensitive protein RarD
MNKGILFAVGAYSLWGILPIYWKTIQSVPAEEIIAHRMAWTFIFLLIVITTQRDWRGFINAIKKPRTVMVFILAASVLSINWLTYVWGVNSGYIVETSLGYFINPLVSVLLGVVLLKEKLRRWQWLPIGLAFIGVLYLTFNYGVFPWIGLTLAFTFGTYGYIKKTAALNSLHGLTLETAVMSVVAVPYLIFLETSGSGAFGSGDILQTILLILAGVATGVPLLLFGEGARRIHLSSIGILQFIAPTIQFLIGVFIYGEDFSQDRLIGFSLIWIALAIYTVEGILERRKRKF